MPHCRKARGFDAQALHVSQTMGCSVSRDTVSRGTQTKLEDFLDARGILKETLYLTLKEEASMVDSSIPGRSIEAFLDTCGGGYVYDGLRRSLRSIYLDGYGPLQLLSGVSVLRLDIQIPALPALQELRDRVLGGDFERDVNAFLAVADPFQIQVDQARFLEVYEQCLRAFGEPAPEQRDKLKETTGLQETHLRLSSPSLAASFLDLLEVRPSAQGLYVASTEAKVLDFVQCLADQIQKDSGDRSTPERCLAKMKDTLSRLTLLHAPYTTLLLPELDGNYVYTEPVFNVDETFDFGMFEGTPKVLSECFEADRTLPLRIADSRLSSDPTHLASSHARCKLPELPSSSSPLVSADDEEQPVACLGLGGPNSQDVPFQLRRLESRLLMWVHLSFPFAGGNSSFNATES